MPGVELFDDIEKQHVQDVLNTGVYMRYGFDIPRQGVWKSKQLENAIADYFKVNHVQLTSSGTTALTTCLAINHIGYGDEVIVPCFTFVASVEAIISVGASPVFVDIDDSLTLCVQSIKNAISPKTKAIMAVHMCGSMANLEALQKICQEHHLILIEDACQSIGATYKGKYLGTIGDAGSFSFDYVKTITCGEGGAVLTNKKELYTMADGFTDHGHDHLGVDRGADQHPFMGYNFRISELQAAVGLAQISKLDNFLSLQRKHYQIFENILKQNKQIKFRKIWDTSGNSCTFLSWFLPNESVTHQFIEALKKENLLAGNFYWYVNNWHYIKQWQHILKGPSLYKLNPHQEQTLQAISLEQFAKSHAIMSCCISTLISLKWDQAIIEQKAYKYLEILKKLNIE